MNIASLSGIAHAADTLVPVSPPTDWTGIAVIAVIGFVIVALVGYIVHIKKTPGAQLGEAELEKIADLLHAKLHPPAVASPPEPLVFDGITFADENALHEYTAAKAVIDAHKPIP